MPHHTMGNDYRAYIEGEGEVQRRADSEELIDRKGPKLLPPIPEPAELTAAIDDQKKLVSMLQSMWASAERRRAGVRKLLNGAEIDEGKARDAKNLAEGRLRMLELQRRRCEQGIEPNMFYVRGEE